MIQHSNLALQKPALQSSISQYSFGQSPAEDAKGGNDGNLSCHYGMHTGTETDPWWQVDLEDSFLIQRVVVFNRWEQADRLNRFTILGSLDGKQWRELFRKTDDKVFGETGDPFSAGIGNEPPARFVRVRLDGHAPLHFRECQVFGVHADPEKRARVEKRNYVRPGRRGRIVPIGGFAVFVDDENYDRSIVEALERGDYREPERQLVSQMIAEGDRILDLGTAVGILAMTAARMAGAQNVLTIDANADIVNDAQDNFRRNSLEHIGSQIGVLRNRQTITDPHQKLPFYIEKAFWASRTNPPAAEHNIVKTVQVPILCLEDAIANHRATVLLCDLAGGEVELLRHADLSRIRLVILTTSYWTLGEAAVDEMVNRMVGGGFTLDLGRSGFSPYVGPSHRGVLVLSRGKP